jgi:hypothetical protein
MGFVISKLLGVVDAAVQGNVDGKDQISHLFILHPSYQRL